MVGGRTFTFAVKMIIFPTVYTDLYFRGLQKQKIYLKGLLTIKYANDCQL